MAVLLSRPSMSCSRRPRAIHREGAQTVSPNARHAGQARAWRGGSIRSENASVCQPAAWHERPSLARLFISHASAENAAALALRAWLCEQGFDDVFLDIDPEGGIAPGERWQ